MTQARPRVGRRPTPVLAMLLALLALLTACAPGAADRGGVTTGATDGAGAGADRIDRGPMPAEDAGGTGAGHDAEGEEGDDRSPLGRHLGYEIPGFGGGDELELRRLEQDTIAGCMREQGFAYVAWVEDPAVVYVPVEEGLDPASRRFATTYGYGVSTQFYAQADVGPGLVGHRGDGSGVDLEENPNTAIRAGLGPEELLAYDRAFFGADSPILGGTGSTVADDPTGILAARELVAHGCLGEAQRAIDGEASALLDVYAVELLGMRQRALADPRYLAHAQDVERCVNEAGYDFYRHTPPWSTLAHFDELIFRFDESIGGRPFDQLDDVDLGDLTAEEIDALHDRKRTIPDEAKDRLAEIQDLETGTATAAWDCGGSAAAEGRVLDEIIDELQAEFIEANRDDLERFRR